MLRSSISRDSIASPMIVDALFEDRDCSVRMAAPYPYPSLARGHTNLTGNCHVNGL